METSRFAMVGMVSMSWRTSCAYGMEQCNIIAVLFDGEISIAVGSVSCITWYCCCIDNMEKCRITAVSLVTWKNVELLLYQ